MTTCQFLTIDFDQEMVNTRKILERIPLDESHSTYKPHERSAPLAQLATHVAEIPSWFKMALESEMLELPADFKPRIAGSTTELLELFDSNVNAGRMSLDGATDSEMQKSWTFKFGDHITFTEVRTKVIRSFINHLVHHRAQLGVYLRLNGIPVPGMYGPSADEAW